MRRWIAGLLLLCAPFAGAKTRLLVEDPNNVVAGRYSLTAQQETDAKQTAESLLNSLSDADLQKALTVRFVAVDARPLTTDQARKEPGSLRDAQDRLGHYGVEVPDGQPLSPITIYDTEWHRIIHGRLYTVTELPKLRFYGDSMTTSTSILAVRPAFRRTDLEIGCERRRIGDAPAPEGKDVPLGVRPWIPLLCHGSSRSPIPIPSRCRGCPFGPPPRRSNRCGV